MEAFLIEGRFTLMIVVIPISPVNFSALPLMGRGVVQIVTVIIDPTH